ncbi:hypothetical protein BD779DRAFT_1482732 [Infundibulicybe gibba]|nr:hypothetical protein BD779DRAFT_1482732 [Infundibulicybe gibba]
MFTPSRKTRWRERVCVKPKTRWQGSVFTPSRKTRWRERVCAVKKRGGRSVLEPGQSAVAGARLRPIKNAMVAACLRPIRYTAGVNFMPESGNVAGVRAHVVSGGPFSLAEEDGTGRDGEWTRSCPAQRIRARESPSVCIDEFHLLHSLDRAGGNGELGTHPRCIVDAGKKSCEIIEVKAAADLRFPSSKHQLHLLSAYSISRIQTAWHDLDKMHFAGWTRGESVAIWMIGDWAAMVNPRSLSVEVLRVKDRICAGIFACLRLLFEVESPRRVFICAFWFLLRSVSSLIHHQHTYLNPESRIPNPAQPMDDIRVFILRPNNPSRAFGAFMKWVVREAILRNWYRLQGPMSWYTWVIMGYPHESSDTRTHLTVRAFVGGWASWNDSAFFDNGGSWEREGRSLNVAAGWEREGWFFNVAADALDLKDGRRGMRTNENRPPSRALRERTPQRRGTRHQSHDYAPVGHPNRQRNVQSFWDALYGRHIARVLSQVPMRRDRRQLRGHRKLRKFSKGSNCIHAIHAPPPPSSITRSIDRRTTMTQREYVIEAGVLSVNHDHDMARRMAAKAGMKWVVPLYHVDGEKCPRHGGTHGCGG